MTRAILESLAVTAEVCGTEISQAAARVIAAELSAYPVEAVQLALKRLAREHQGRLTLAAIVSRIDDGRPTADAAWSTMPRDDHQTAVLTDEQMAAWSVAAPMLADGDKIGARLAYCKEYVRQCEIARAEGKPVRWHASLGYDAAGRESVILEAVQQGKLTMAEGQKMLPTKIAPSARVAALMKNA